MTRHEFMETFCRLNQYRVISTSMKRAPFRTLHKKTKSKLLLKWLKTVSSTQILMALFATLYHLMLQSWYQKTAQANH